MASGKDLRRRIQSTKNTQQITKAMKMVSAAKLRRAQDAIIQARPYAKGIKEVIVTLAKNRNIRELHPLLEARQVKKVNIILVTSDRGLCGGFNSNLNKRAERLYKEEAGKYEKFEFTCFGKRGYEYLKLRKIPVRKYYQDFFRGLNYPKVDAAGQEFIEGFLNGEYDEVRLIYAEFRSAISQVVVRETLLPVDLAVTEEDKNQVILDFVFDSNEKELLDAVLPRYFKTEIYKALLESLASEHGARMAAMDSATKNADEVKQQLTLEYNKLRQAGITKELLEITSGAEALK